jgi:hypothetical protein
MDKPTESKWIFALQIGSVAAMWAFVLTMSGWIIHLIRLSHRLNDVPSASVGISIVAIPVFLIGATVLTYVFVGLQKGRRNPESEVSGGEEHLP